MGAWLLLLLAVEPVVEPPAPRPDQYDLHLWTEPVTLVRNFTEAQERVQPVVVPLGFDYRLNKPWWLAVEMTLIYRNDQDVQMVGGVLSLGLQLQIGHFGPIAFFVEPRLMGAVLSQQPSRPLAPGASCFMGCVIQATELEFGGGANFGAAVTWNHVYLAILLGGQFSYYSGGDQSVLGDPVSRATQFILFNEHADSVSPNLSFVRIGGTF